MSLPSQPAAPIPYAEPPARLSPMPQSEVEYPQTLRVPTARWWKGPVVLVLFVVGYLLLSVLLELPVLLYNVAAGRLSLADIQANRLTLTPGLLLSVNIANALSIPLSGLLIWGFYRQPVRWMHSVVGWVRWRLMLRALALVGPIWLVFLLLTTVLSPPQLGRFTGQSVLLLLIVVLTTPLQAAGEEYGARGLINRVAGSWFADRRWSLLAGALLSSLVFMVAHGARSWWLAAYFFVMGLGLAVVVWRTGGLEVAIVIHGVNNIASFAISIIAGQEPTLDRSAGSGGPIVVLPMLMLAGLVALVCWLAQRENVRRTFRPAVGPS